MNKFRPMVSCKALALYLPLLAIMAVDAQAKHPFINQDPAGPAPEATAPLTAPEFKQALKDARSRAKRSVAANDSFYDTGALSWQFRNMRNELIGNGPAYGPNGPTGTIYPGLKIPEAATEQEFRSDEFKKALNDFDSFFKKLGAFQNDPNDKDPYHKALGNDDTYYNSLDTDAKFAAAQLAPLVIFRGFFNRSQDLFQNANLSHAGAVTALRALASGVVTYLPTDQWKAGLRYVTYPNADWPYLIDSEEHLHWFIEREALPALVKMAHRLEALNFAGKAVYFDNQILYGTADFGNEKDRFIRLGEPERRFVLANTYATISGLMSLTSYWMGGLFKASDDIAKKYGFGSIFSANVGSARTRFQILRAYNTSTGLFNFRGPAFKSWMSQSYGWLVKAAESAKLSWAELGCLSGDDGATQTNSCTTSQRTYSDSDRSGAVGNATQPGNLFDPRTFVAFNRVAAASLNGLDYVVNGDGKELQSAVFSGESVKVSLKKFYEPEPPANLTAFFPTTFYGDDGKDQYEVKTDVVVAATANTKRAKTKIGQKIVDELTGVRYYHNYIEGNPKTWDSKIFSQYFSPVNGDQDVRNLARITAQTWGGWLVGVPLGALMF